MCGLGKGLIFGGWLGFGIRLAKGTMCLRRLWIRIAPVSIRPLYLGLERLVVDFRTVR